MKSTFIEYIIREKLKNLKQENEEIKNKERERMNRIKEMTLIRQGIDNKFRIIHKIIYKCSLSIDKINKIDESITNQNPRANSVKPKNLKINITYNNLSKSKNKEENPSKQYMKTFYNKNVNYFNNINKNIDKEYEKIVNENEERKLKIEKLIKILKREESYRKEKEIKENIFITNSQTPKKKIKNNNLHYNNISNVRSQGIINDVYPVNLNGMNRLNRIIKKYIIHDDKKKIVGKKCCVCLETIKQNDNTIYYPCFHLFHKKCILEWLKIKTVCPICKFDIKLFL